MSTAYSHKERRLPNSDEADPMMNDNGPEPKLNHGLPGNLRQLMFGHLPVRFVIDSVDFASLLRTANNPSKIDRCA
jgi:hypothetical protein